MERTTILPEQISIVVRGLVIGNGQPDERKKFTKRALASVRKYLPGAQIILSTWKGADVSGLDYDDIITSDPPEMVYTILPDGTRFANSTNHQIVSTQAGVTAVKRAYTLVMRSDMILTGTGFMDYFIHYNKHGSEGVLKHRVVVLPTFNAKKTIKFKLLFNTPDWFYPGSKTKKAIEFKLLFNTADWFYFGSTEDIKNIFTIPLMDATRLIGEKVNGYFQQAENFGTEQYIWVNFLKKNGESPFSSGYHYSEEMFAASEASYVQNTIMVPAGKADILCLKMPHSAYGAPPILSSGLYTFNEYKKIYNQYNTHKIFYLPNIPEEICYAVILYARLVAKKIGPSIYNGIVNFMRKRRAGENSLP